jgi:hypothetical protein
MGSKETVNTGTGPISTSKTNLELSHFSIQVNRAFSPETSENNYSPDLLDLINDLPQ